MFLCPALTGLSSCLSMSAVFQLSSEMFLWPASTPVKGHESERTAEEPSCLLNESILFCQAVMCENNFFYLVQQDSCSLSEARATEEPLFSRVWPEELRSEAAFRK